jgi:hypothetical protein
MLLADNFVDTHVNNLD